ncbi:hypothetical protein KXR87_15360 [Yokenella regensburgei]|uniref:YncE family protein n=1 Tax=Yokenella regensburgei TaxID=158877 RepID=UPI003F1908FF
MSLTHFPARSLTSLLVVATVSLSAATQAESTAIRPDAMKREALAPTLVEMAWSAKQQAIFVSAPDWKEEAQSKVLRLDPRTLTIEAAIPLAVKGFGVALDDSRNRLYLTEGFNGAVGVVDTAGNRSIGQIPVQEKVNLEAAYRKAGISGARLDYLLAELKRFKIVDDYLYKVREATFDPQTGRLFLPGLGYGVDSVLFVVDTRSGRLEKTLPGFGFYATGVAIDKNGRRVFVSNMQGQLMTVNADTLTLESTKEIQADQLLNLVYDPASNRLLGVDQGIDRDKPRNNYLQQRYTRRSSGHRLFALNADSGEVLTSEATDEVPIGLLLDERTRRIFVTNRNGVRVAEGKGTLTVFDAATLKHLQTVDLPPHPNSLALDPASNVLFVTVKNDGDATKSGNPESVVRIQQ